MKNSLFTLFVAILFCSANVIAGITSGTSYYLYNVGAGMWLNFGGSDGYHAAFLDYGSPLLFTASGDGYKLTNTHYDSGSGLSSSGLGKTTASVLTFIEQPDGTYTMKGSQGYFGFAGTKSAFHSQTSVAYNLSESTSDNIKWRLFTKEDLIAQLDNASAENPIDATFYIVAPGFNRHEYGLNSEWILTDCNVANTYYNPDQTGFCINDVDAGKQKTFVCAQTLTGLKPGKYVLTCQGFYRAGSAGDALTSFNAGNYPNNAVLYAGDATCPLKPIYYAGEGLSNHTIYDNGKATNSSWSWTNYTSRSTTAEGAKYYPYWSTGNQYPNSSACVAFDNGLYQATNDYNRVEFTVYENQAITIGVKSLAAIRYDWAAWDNMHLEYLGNDGLEPATGLKPIVQDRFDGTVTTAWTYEEIGAHTHGGFPIATQLMGDGTSVDASKLQVWTGTTYNLGNSDTYVNYTGINNGYYLISADVRVYDENGGYDGTVEGLSMFANEVEKPITTGEQIKTGTLAGKGFCDYYSVLVKVTDGNLKSGFRLRNTSFNWLSFNNVVLRYLGEEDPTSNLLSVDIPANEYTALCMPYEVSSDIFGQVYVPVAINGNEVSLLPVERVKAGQPCIVKGNGTKAEKSLEDLNLSYSTPLLSFNALDNAYAVGNYDTNSWSMIMTDGTEKSADDLSYTVLDTENLSLTMTVENRAVERYAKAANYTENPSASIITQYNVAPPTRLDQPKIFSMPLSDGSYLTIQNMIPGEEYEFDYTDGKGTHYSGKVTAEGEIRMIYLSSGHNIRDLGGKTGIDGKKVKYGRIYRGATLNGHVDASNEDLDYLRNELNIGAEIDLRYKDDYDKDKGCGISPFGYTVADGNYYFAGANDYTAANLNESATQNRLKEEFLFILGNLKQGKSVYYHCAWGADRTGMLSMLLNGILGISAKDIYIDYELTSFSIAGNRLCTSFKDRMAVITSLTGSNLTEKFENYFKNKLGVTQSQIDEFRGIMFDGDIYLDEEMVCTLPEINTTVNVKSNRTLNVGKWNSLCLPYDMEASEFERVIEASEVEDHENGLYSMKFSEVTGTLQAGHPYLVKPFVDKQSVEKNAVIIKVKEPATVDLGLGASITGTFEPITLKGQYYVNSNMFYQADVDVPMKGYRAYITLPSDAQVRAFAIDEETGVIELLDNSMQDGKYISNEKIIIVKNGKKYNLNGIKL